MKTFVVYYLFALVVLGATYPPPTYIRYFAFPWWSSVLSYAVFAALITLVAAVLIPAAASRLYKPQSASGKLLDALAVGGANCVALSGLAIAIVRSGVDIPFTWVRGLFFPDWELFRFLAFDVTMLSAGSFALRLFRNCRQVARG